MHLKGTGTLMTEIQEYVELRKQGDSTINQRKQLLQSVRKRSVADINERKSHLEILSLKIDWYDGKLKHKVNENFEEYIKRFR